MEGKVIDKIAGFRSSATKKEKIIIERIKDGKDYEIVVPPEDNYFNDINFYYKCFIAVKEVQNDSDR